ncbi:MAG: tRNA lysidine(34) synthetase TilS [Acidimicrobiales bacterium]
MSGPPPRSPADRRHGPAGDPLTGALLTRCTFPDPGTDLVCGVSGGADSLALLLLATAAGCRVTAVHVDHGLRPGSAGEAERVASVAARFGAAFRAERVVVADGPNLEARARQARRRALGPDAATGHTADDQAETVLANLLRGAGVSGLAAMRAGPRHPLLDLRRTETEALCDHFGLEALRDPSNDDPRFVRNRIRHELLPLCSDIARRDVVPLLARQARVLAGDAEVLDAVASLVDGSDAAALSAAPDPVARRSVRRWLAGDDPYPPPLDAVERVLEVARSERRATELPGGRRVSRSHGRLSLAPADPVAPGAPEGRRHSGTVGP